MLRIVIWFLAVICGPVLLVAQGKDPSVLLAILARNQAHTLPHYLDCVDKFDYDKQSIVVYINTNNNDDATGEILKAWTDRNRDAYKLIIFEEHSVDGLGATRLHQWTPQRLKLMGSIRNRSLQMAKQCGCEYYFVADCDNFLIPATLRDLVAKQLPIVSPMLISIPKPGDAYSNFFLDVSESGYWKGHPDFLPILERTKVGTFPATVVHCAYLIRTEHVDKLNYIDETTHHEFIIFSRSARANGVQQYICNERLYGTQLHFEDSDQVPREEVVRREKAVMAALTGQSTL